MITTHLARRYGWSAVETFLVIAIVGVLVALGVPAFHAMRNRRANAETDLTKVVLSQTTVPGDTLYTVLHDGHHFVWVASAVRTPGVLLHHPSCPCAAR